MAEIKTKPGSENVTDFLNKIQDEVKRNDCMMITKMMQKASGEVPQVWGGAMIGFGNVRYKSARSGREVDWFKIGFAPRKANISLHLVIDINEHAEDLEKLGKHKTGVGCLYINKLSDIEIKILEKMIKSSVKKKPASVQ